MRTATVLIAFMIVVVAVGVLSTPWIADAQPAGKVYRVGYLSSGIRSPAYEIFQRKLQELGYVEGRNLVLEG